MSFLDTLIENIPEIKPSTQKKLSFTSKLKWTGIILALYFLLGLIPLYGLGQNALEQFAFLGTILGASFGSIISLGIGPIVTGSIVLQLLQGSGIIHFDLTSDVGKRRFQGLQKLFSIAFIIIEAFIFVMMGGLSPAAGISPLILILQLCIGGVFILMMDEIVSKYGFGSGISLFIAAGVSQQIFIQLFSPLPSPFNPEIASGAIPVIIQSLGQGDTLQAGLKIAQVLATIAVFLFVVYVQAMKVEIPLSFGRIAGQGIRWPLQFMYANVLPIILVSALVANIQLLARLLQNMGAPLLGTFAGNAPISGFVYWLTQPNILQAAIVGSITWVMIGQALTYTVVYVIGATVFSIFWVQTSGLDASSQAKQMISSGLQIPGFRRDQRVLEKLLKRYIWPLTVMGGIAVGLLASMASLTGAIGTGTGLLLTVMIIYKLYEDIAKQHMYDMNPMMRKFISI
ncbi:preprotein translocase subunit SecY [Candidatus Woesearchaeota archaeon CG10_big_fil_rev_8_21_14_0_10_32_9]|nr:MAG: preprotein translocase subunit SecY [Candidatus Woesearchaeota archaeon CG10_big_fil_rev_8_21_14_0_10_32_9]